MTPQQTVAAGYDKIADEYAALEKGGAWPRLRWLAKVLARLKPGSSVLDIGCGSGIPADVQIAMHHSVVGIDISKEQIRRAVSNVPSGRFICADISSTEAKFDEGSFDAVVSFYTFEHVPRASHLGLLRRIHGWTKPHGYLLISMEAGEYEDVHGRWLGVPMFISCYNPETTRKMVQEAGYEILETAIEDQLEGDHGVPYLWILARKRNPTSDRSRPPDRRRASDTDVGRTRGGAGPDLLMCYNRWPGLAALLSAEPEQGSVDGRLSQRSRRQLGSMSCSRAGPRP